MKNNYKIGDRVKVIANTKPKHHFPIGTEATVRTEAELEHGRFQLWLVSGRLPQTVNIEDVELLNMKNEIKVGDRVRMVTESGDGCSHYIKKGAFATVTDVQGINKFLVKPDNISDFIITSAASEQEVSKKDIELVENTLAEIKSLLNKANEVTGIGLHSVTVFSDGSGHIACSGNEYVVELHIGDNIVEVLNKYISEAERVKVKLTSDYTAEVTKNGIKVGCQDISWDAFDDLVRASRKVRR